MNQPEHPRPSHAVSELAARLGGSVRGDGSIAITGVNGLADAGPTELTFIAAARHVQHWPASRAAAAIVSANIKLPDCDDARPLIIVPDAEAAIHSLLELFDPGEESPGIGAHPSAAIDPTARIGRAVRIGANAVIGPRCVIGDGVCVHAGVVLYDRVEIGEGSAIHAGTVIRSRCRVGRNVILHQNVSIGADGFGYRPDPSGRGLLKVRHVGHVVIEDDVEIGAGTCVDRGKFGATVIGAGSKLDNLVQIAHNCRLGRCCIIAGQTGLAGSVTLGDGVMIGGQAAVKEHCSLGSGCRVGACSGVMTDIPAGETWVGLPAKPAQAALRQEASIRKLPDLLRRVATSLPPDGGSGGR